MNKSIFDGIRNSKVDYSLIERFSKINVIGPYMSECDFRFLKDKGNFVISLPSSADQYPYLLTTCGRYLLNTNSLLYNVFKDSLLDYIKYSDEQIESVILRKEEYDEAPDPVKQLAYSMIVIEAYRRTLVLI